MLTNATCTYIVALCLRAGPTLLLCNVASTNRHRSAIPDIILILLRKQDFEASSNENATVH